jgi:hypothetical protein
MTRLVTVIEMWENRGEGWSKTVYTADELRMIYPERRNKPRKCRSHAVKVLAKRGLI